MDGTADDGKWKRVGKAKAKTRAQRQNLVNNMPKVQDLDYAKAQSVLRDNDHIGQPLHDTSNIQNQDPKQGMKIASKTKQKKTKKLTTEPKFNYRTIEEALKNENLSLDDQLVQLKEKFPNNSNIWLKDIASQLNISLRCAEESPTFSGHPLNYPLCKAKKSTYDTLMCLFGSELKPAVAPLMFQHCLNSMLDCITRDIPSWGYRLCIQAMTHCQPDLCCLELEKYVEKIQHMQNVPKRCLSLLWALGQVGYNDLMCGMKVWLELMLPTLHMKNIAQYSMTYIESLLERANNNSMQELSGIIQAEQFLEIARWRFGSKPTAKSTTFVKERIQEVYPTFRKLVMSTSENKQELFACILCVSNEQSSLLKCELIGLAVECMETNSQCFKIWRDLYITSFYWTRLFLLHVLDNWGEITRKLPRQPFRDTIRAFHNTNSDAAARSDPLTSRSEFAEIRSMCENMNERLSDPIVHTTPLTRIFFTALFVALLSVTVGVVVVDVRNNGGVWEKSQTYAFLKSKGVISLANHVWARSQHFAEVASSWLKTNVPLYWNMTCEILGPYFQEVVSIGTATFYWVMNAIQPSWRWLINQTGVIFEQVVEFTEPLLLQFLEIVDKCFNYCWLMAIWFAEMLASIGESISMLWGGELSWEAVHDDLTSFAYAAYNRTVNSTQAMVRIVANYIAPDKP
ncbi:unnamed protein product [Clavelina lepadiformis]|uniref:Transmembrane protein 214 n=1 Tax=Clavelina lepadiformis TaxID=159417 RepID=A0ABP0H2A3_CLALP